MYGTGSMDLNLDVNKVSAHYWWLNSFSSAHSYVWMCNYDIIFTFIVSQMDIHQFNHNIITTVPRQAVFVLSRPLADHCRTVLPVDETSLTAPCSEWRFERLAVGLWHHRCSPACLWEPAPCAGRSQAAASDHWTQNYWSAQQDLHGKNKLTQIIVILYACLKCSCYRIECRSLGKQRRTGILNQRAKGEITRDSQNHPNNKQTW